MPRLDSYGKLFVKLCHASVVHHPLCVCPLRTTRVWSRYAHTIIYAACVCVCVLTTICRRLCFVTAMPSRLVVFVLSSTCSVFELRCCGYWHYNIIASHFEENCQEVEASSSSGRLLPLVWEIYSRSRTSQWAMHQHRLFQGRMPDD